MDTLVRSVALAALLSVCGVHHVSGFTQTDVPHDDEALRSSHEVARVYVAAQSATYDTAVTASNLGVAPVYRPLIDTMLSQSPTFRRQWARLAAAGHLSVLIRSDGPNSSRAGAMTSIQQRPGGRIEAIVQVGVSKRTAELIAHELEHIIEQLDGVDLRAKSRLAASGVRRVWDLGAYETERAIATGLRVAREISQGMP
jgi:hypothetical protein